MKPCQVVERAYLPEKTKRTEMIEGKPSEAAAKLVRSCASTHGVCCGLRIADFAR